MQADNYKESIKEALNNLISINESIFNSMIDIIMQSELKEWNGLVPVGEVHQFHFDIFKNSDDVNIQLLVQLMYKVDEAFNIIKDINNIQMGE